MNRIKPFEKPIGFHDLLPEVAEKKRVMENMLQALFEKWGYKEMLTPILEYEETVGRASKIESNKLFKLLDKKGNTLVLRPDMTSPIARVVSSVLKDHTLPIRLSYHANVFRAQANEAGRDAEFFQTGVELVGEGTPDADAEILAIAIEALSTLKVGPFKLVVGHSGFLDGLFAEIMTDKAAKERLKVLLAEKNYVGYKESVYREVSNKAYREELLSILHYQGDIQLVRRLLTTISSDKTKTALKDLEKIWQLLTIYRMEKYITFDLALVPHLGYYTGLVFEANVSNLGFTIGSGGRYDSLLDSFNNPMQAIGFALKINRLLDISNVTRNIEEQIKIIYDEGHQREALQYANELRNSSNKVVETYKLLKDENHKRFQEESGIKIIKFLEGDENER